jgi:GWxTD domain-containing protein
MTRIIRFAAALLIALPLFAGQLGKYWDWPQSPQGHFMTKAERAEWTTLTSEADAEKFIATFLAKRDPQFAANVAKAVENANKYLTVGDTPGSQSLRGKIVILLGPPSSMDVSAKKSRSGGRSASSEAMASMGGSEGTGPSIADVADVDQRSGMDSPADSGIKRYTLTYGAEQLPTKKGASFVVEVNSRTGKEKMDKRALAEAEKIFAAAAEASIKR